MRALKGMITSPIIQSVEETNIATNDSFPLFWLGFVLISYVCLHLLLSLKILRNINIYFYSRDLKNFRNINICIYCHNFDLNYGRMQKSIVIIDPFLQQSGMALLDGPFCQTSASNISTCTKQIAPLSYR